MMLALKPLVFGGAIALSAILGLGFLAFKYHGDLVEAGIENQQLRSEIGNLKSEKILLEQLHARRLAEVTKSFKEEQQNVEVINNAPDDGCLDTLIPSDIVDRLFPEKR